MRKSLAEYHLNYLEKNQVILAVVEERYKRYYAQETDIPVEDKKVLALVRQKIPFDIIRLLLKYKFLPHKDIADKLDIPLSTLSYHLNKLQEQGLIDSQKYGEDKGYFIKDKKSIMKFLLRYEMHSAVDSFKEIWDNIE